MPEIYPIHDLSYVFPDMTADEFTRLRDDIAEHGLRSPIAIWQGEVLDGRHRMQACIEARVPPRYEMLDDDTDPLPYVLSQNFQRRHLTESQMGLVVAQLTLYKANHGGDRRSAERAEQSSMTIADGAEIAGVSKATVSRGRSVLRDGADSVVDAVRDGKISLRDAAEVVRHDDDVQNAAVEDVEAGTAKTASEAAETRAPRKRKVVIDDQALRIGELENEVAFWKERAGDNVRPDDLSALRKLQEENRNLQVSVNTWMSRCHDLETEVRTLRERQQRPRLV